MKERLQYLLSDLKLFYADLKSLCDREAAREAFVTYWQEVRHDNYQKFPLILTAAVHIGALLLSLTAPYLMRSRPRIPEVYTVQLYRVQEEAPAPVRIEVKKPVKEAPPQPVAPPTPVKVKAVSLDPIKRRLLKEKEEKDDLARQERLRMRKMDEVRLDLQKQQAEKEAQNAADRAVSKIAELYRRTTQTKETDSKPPVKPVDRSEGSSSGEVSARELEAVERYKARLISHIQPNWELPELQDWDKTLEAVIVMKVKYDGTVTDTWLEKKSSNYRFNQYVRKAVENSLPLPPFPLDFQKKSEEIAVTFYPGGLM